MANVYNNAKTLFFGSNTLDLDAGGDTYKVLLLKSSESYDPDDEFVSELANEVSGGGYARQTFAGRVVTQDDTDDRAEASGNNSVFPTVATGQTIGAAVIFKDLGGADSANILVSFHNLTNTPATGENVTVKWDGGSSSGDFLRVEG